MSKIYHHLQEVLDKTCFTQIIETMKLKEIEIKPGMVIVTKNTKYIAFPSKRYNCPIAFADITAGGWTYNIPEICVEKIYDLTTNVAIDSGKLLWAQEWDREITMSEIAEKFGIPVKCLRIKKE